MLRAFAASIHSTQPHAQPPEKRRRVLRVVAFEKGAELLKSVPSELGEVEGRPVRVPMKFSILEEVFPVGNVLVNRQGKVDAFESCAVRALPPAQVHVAISAIERFEEFASMREFTTLLEPAPPVRAMGMA